MNAHTVVSIAIKNSFGRKFASVRMNYFTKRFETMDDSKIGKFIRCIVNVQVRETSIAVINCMESTFNWDGIVANKVPFLIWRGEGN